VIDSPAFEAHLVREEILTEDTLNQSRSEAAKSGVALIDVVEQLGYASAEALYRSMACFCEMRYVLPSQEDIEPDIADKVPARFATHYGFMPLSMENGTLVIAVSDPLNSHLLDDIRHVLNQRIEAVVSTPEEIKRATKKLYGLGADTVEQILSDSANVGAGVNLQASDMGMDLGDQTIDGTIVKFVNQVFHEAIQSEATDVHIEPFEEELRVRYRIDGVLHQVPTPVSIRGFQSAIVSRVKVMANLNIAEKRLPQDGKIMATIGSGKYDLRVSVLPTPYGETINIRILTRSSIFMSLQDLGFMDDDLKQINSFIKKPHGIILVTGPTGSGKSTTLYAALNKLNQLDRKTITIEDPIEYQLHGITQMQVLPQIGFDFARGLRSMLRHDPDIMMVGEIRDYETAEMAIRSSLTGHLVFSTLHTNDAAGTVTRLIDMGVEPFLIASTMIAAMAQRLVRKVCENCGETDEPPADALVELGVSADDISRANFRKGSGCDACRNTGYKGRVAICEVLSFTPDIKELTVTRATSLDIKRKGRELGMRTLREAGWERVMTGDTSVEEVLRVTADTDTVFD
jgi:type II secretory ATPase GspE/PulE/Tfp pilus assembly ATPase PilB-like protein